MARSAWHKSFADVCIDQLVFADEFGCTTTMQRTHGRAQPGERVVSRVPGGHLKMLSTIATLTVRGIGASANFEGATDTDTFVAFTRNGLVPVLRPGDVVVLDSLSVHKSVQVRGLIEQAGARLVHLPPYSPDLNPIEMAISKIKSLMRTLAHRSVDGLLDGLDDALGSIRPEDALGYITHCGYAR